MRGTRLHDGSRYFNPGIIPAYAGNTSAQTLLLSVLRDHPRVCGEHQYGERITVRKWGSSPRMRGTLVKHIVKRARRGIIPAYAGNTCRIRSPPRSRWDHPRVCGEHSVQIVHGCTIQGSSPRMRGTLAAHKRFIAQHGIIPAYAGNTIVTVLNDNGERDHPRVCGEHSSSRSFFSVVEGSSPRMRGTPLRQIGNGLGGGDHPRVCGEHDFILSGLSYRLGSSPRMRGTLTVVRIAGRSAGIIPAYAGNTCAVKGGTSYDWDHPRVCGEHPFLLYQS